MNICFIQGKIVSKIEYKFIVNTINTAIAIFEIELKNKSIIIIKAYDEIADYCYKTLNLNESILIEGILNSKLEVKVNKLEIV